MTGWWIVVKKNFFTQKYIDHTEDGVGSGKAHEIKEFQRESSNAKMHNLTNIKPQKGCLIWKNYLFITLSTTTKKSMKVHEKITVSLVIPSAL